MSVRRAPLNTCDLQEDVPYRISILVYNRCYTTYVAMDSHIVLDIRDVKSFNLQYIHLICFTVNVVGNT